MRENLYDTMNQQFGSLYSSRPNIQMGPTTWTSTTAMVQVWRQFHDAAPQLSNVEPFLFDYVDITRQVRWRGTCLH